MVNKYSLNFNNQQKIIRLCTINLKTLKHLTYVVTYFKIAIAFNLIHTSNIIVVHEYKQPFPDEDILSNGSIKREKKYYIALNI